MSNLSSAKNALASKKPLKNLLLTIVIEGESACNLFPVGPVDIRDYFLEHGFGNTDFKPKDVKSIKFTVPAKLSYQKRVKKSVHRDNF
jgi:hypothetical protein